MKNIYLLIITALFFCFFSCSNDKIISEYIQGIYKDKDLIMLDWLFLDNREINKIEGLDKLHNLEALFLHKNNIRKIEGLDKLENLVFLDLSDNHIEKIEGMSRLYYLENLNIRNNKIRVLENLENLSNLENLFIDGNPITGISERTYESLRKLRVNVYINEDDYMYIESYIQSNGIDKF